MFLILLISRKGNDWHRFLSMSEKMNSKYNSVQREKLSHSWFYWFLDKVMIDPDFYLCQRTWTQNAFHIQGEKLSHYWFHLTHKQVMHIHTHVSACPGTFCTPTSMCTSSRVHRLLIDLDIRALNQSFLAKLCNKINIYQSHSQCACVSLSLSQCCLFFS